MLGSLVHSPAPLTVPRPTPLDSVPCPPAPASAPAAHTLTLTSYNPPPPLKVVLAGVVLINNRVGAFLLLLPLPIITGLVASSLRRKYYNLSSSIPLETAQAIDIGILRTAAQADRLQPPPIPAASVSSAPLLSLHAGATPLEDPEGSDGSSDMRT